MPRRSRKLPSFGRRSNSFQSTQSGIRRICGGGRSQLPVHGFLVLGLRNEPRYTWNNPTRQHHVMETPIWAANPGGRTEPTVSRPNQWNLCLPAGFRCPKLHNASRLTHMDNVSRPDERGKLFAHAVWPVEDDRKTCCQRRVGVAESINHDSGRQLFSDLAWRVPGARAYSDVTATISWPCRTNCDASNQNILTPPPKGPGGGIPWKHLRIFMRVPVDVADGLASRYVLLS